MSDEPDATQDLNFDGDIGKLDVLAIHAYEIFCSLTRAGFSHKDALVLVGHLVSSGFMEVHNYKIYQENLEEEDLSIIDDPDEEDFF
jgi:hypothetical protein